MLWLVLLLLSLLLLLYYYLTVNYNYWQRKGVTGPTPSLVFGNTKDITLLKTTVSEGIRKIYCEYENHSYVGLYELRTPVLLLRDPELIKHVFVKDFDYFQGKSHYIIHFFKEY